MMRSTGAAESTNEVHRISKTDALWDVVWVGCGVCNQSNINEKSCKRTSALGEEKRSILGLIVFLRGEDDLVINNVMETLLSALISC